MSLVSPPVRAASAPAAEPVAAPAAPWRRDARVAGATLAVGAVATAATLAFGVSRQLALLPLLASAALLLGLAALLRFEAFLFVLLAVRAGIDSIAPLGPLEVNVAVSLGFVVAGLVALAGLIRAGAPRPLTTWPSLALLGAGALSLVVSADRGSSGVELLRLASGLLMLEVLQRYARGPREARRLLVAFFVSALPPLATGLVQGLTGHGRVLIADFERVVGTFHHPNPFGIYLTLLLLTVIAVYPHVRAPARLGLIALAVPALACLMFTYTRSAWLAFVFGVLVIGALQSRKLIAGVLVVVVAALVANPAVAARFSDLTESRQASGDAANSLVWRVEYWSETVSLAEGQPITGIGLGMVRRSTVEEKQPHNDFVRAAAELGLLGLAAYVWLLGSLMATARRALRRAGPGLPRGAAVGYAGALGAVLLLSVVSNVLSQVVLLWYVALLTAVATASTASTADGVHTVREG